MALNVDFFITFCFFFFFLPLCDSHKSTDSEVCETTSSSKLLNTSWLSSSTSYYGVEYGVRWSRTLQRGSLLMRREWKELRFLSQRMGPGPSSASCRSWGEWGLRALPSSSKQKSSPLFHHPHRQLEEPMRYACENVLEIVKHARG